MCDHAGAQVLSRHLTPHVQRLRLNASSEGLRRRNPAADDTCGLLILLSAPWARRLRGFALFNCRLGGMMLTGAAGLDLPKLEELWLGGAGLGDYAVGELLAARMPALRSLDLRGDRLTDRGVPAVLSSCGCLERLEELELGSNKLTDAGVAALARAPLHALRRLGLSRQRGAPGGGGGGGSGGALTDMAVAAVVGAAWAPGLVELDLSRNEGLGRDPGPWAALAAAPLAGSLRRLSLAGCSGVGAGVGDVLASAAWLSRLRELDLSETNEGALHSLRASAAFSCLEAQGRVHL
jgi:hypothetical protein